MPTKKVENTIEENTNKDLTVELEAEKAKNKELEGKLDKLTSMMEKLMEEKAPKEISPKVENKHYTVNGYDKYKEIDPTKRVFLTSMLYGRTPLLTTTGKKFTFDNFGDTLQIRFEDLEDLYRKYKNYFTSLEIRILDDDAIDALYLRQYYDKINLTPEDMENLITLDPQELVKRLKGMSTGLRESAISLIIVGVANNDKKYMDRNAWEVIKNAFGVDINDFVDNYAYALKMQQ